MCYDWVVVVRDVTNHRDLLDRTLKCIPFSPLALVEFPFRSLAFYFQGSPGGLCTVMKFHTGSFLSHINLSGGLIVVNTHTTMHYLYNDLQ